MIKKVTIKKLIAKFQKTLQYEYNHIVAQMDISSTNKNHIFLKNT